VLLSGDRDKVVGRAGVNQLLSRLHAAGRTAETSVIHGATHDYVYRTDKAAQRAVWARIDSLIAR
jgi:hypothetical protein